MATAMMPVEAGENLTSLLTSKVDTITELLPARMSGEAERLIKRALLTFHTGSAELRKCTAKSFVMAVLRGAECGLPIDGKLGHAVPYNVKKKDKLGIEHWEMEAVFIPDYKGLISVAKANKTIEDAWAWVVCANDHFEASDENGTQRYCFRPNFSDRGEMIGVLSVVRITPDYSRWDYQTKAEIDSIRGRSKAKGSGPWVTDYHEMAKKTGIKRLLKLFQHDVQLSTALDSDNAQYDIQALASHVARKATVVNPRAAIQHAEPETASGEDESETPDDSTNAAGSAPSNPDADEVDPRLEFVAAVEVKMSAVKTRDRVAEVYREVFEEATRLGVVQKLDDIAAKRTKELGT